VTHGITADSEEHQIGDKVHPDTILSVMMKTRDNWTAVCEFIKTILSKKKEKERG